MVAPPSLKEKQALQAVEEKRKQLLAANKKAAELILLSLNLGGTRVASVNSTKTNGF